MKSNNFIAWLTNCVAILFLAQGVLAEDILQAYRADAIKTWEKEVSQLEAKDKKEVADQDSILFIGSSSIRLWDSIKTDMLPWKAVQRGYGGAKFSDLAVLAPRILAAHHPKAVVIFVANDITGNAKTDKTSNQIVRLLESVVNDIRKQAETSTIFVIAITPTPSRFKVWPEIQQANHAMEEFCKSKERMHFIATQNDYLSAEGQPRAELFKDDKLHQNTSGYKIWSRIIKEHLEEVLGKPAS